MPENNNEINPNRECNDPFLKSILNLENEEITTIIAKKNAESHSISFNSSKLTHLKQSQSQYSIFNEKKPKRKCEDEEKTITAETNNPSKKTKLSKGESKSSKPNNSIYTTQLESQGSCCVNRRPENNELCRATETPQWRWGSIDPKTNLPLVYCNACGLQYSRKVEKEREIPKTNTIKNITINKLIN